MMTSEHRNNLRVNRVFLVKKLVISDFFLDHFVPGDILTDDMREEIQAPGRTMVGKAGLFLDLIAKRGERAYERFIKALEETEQEEIAEEIDKEYKKLKQPNNQGLTAQSSYADIVRDIVNVIADANYLLTPTSNGRSSVNLMSRDVTDLPFRKHENVYAMEKPIHGKATILMCGQSEDMSDIWPYVTPLLDLMNSFNFERCGPILELTPDLLHLNEKLETFASQQSLDSEAFILFLFGNCSQLTIDQITLHFDGHHCRALHNKPKLFFIERAEDVQQRPLVAQSDGPSSSSADAESMDVDVTGQALPTNNTASLIRHEKSDLFVIRYKKSDRVLFLKALIQTFASQACSKSLQDLLQIIKGVMQSVIKSTLGDSTYVTLLQDSTLHKNFYFQPANP